MQWDEKRGKRSDVIGDSNNLTLEWMSKKSRIEAEYGLESSRVLLQLFVFYCSISFFVTDSFT